MNKQELIEKINEIATETPFPDSKIVDLSEAIELIEQLDEPIKLKDVIKRIKDLDIDARKVWIDAILNELGSDYGSKKYRDGYEQGKFEGEWVGQQLKDADKVRQELNKPVVKQFVADWYEKHKDDFEGNLFRCIDQMPDIFEMNKLSEFEEWLIDEHTAPFQTLVNMHQFGYTVEREKRYLVKMKGVDSRTNYLYYGLGSRTWLFKTKNIDGNFRKSHTRKELEQDNFGWVFDCPGIEIEEVEE